MSLLLGQGVNPGNSPTLLVVKDAEVECESPIIYHTPKGKAPSMSLATSAVSKMTRLFKVEELALDEVQKIRRGMGSSI
jgi:hypothetical protein